MPARNREIVWAPAARKDLRDIWHYFVSVASRDVADRLLRDITPRAGVLGNGRLKDDRIEIVRVLHQRRNLPAIFSKPGA